MCDRILGTNIKVSNLVQMLPAARHEILLVNDSDIRVPANYLREVITPLNDDSVGLVTCLYRGLAGPTIGSRLEALGISTDFVPGVLTARFLEKGLHFGLGSTLAFRRRETQRHWRIRRLTRLSGRRLRTRPAHLCHRKANRNLALRLSLLFCPRIRLQQFFRHQLRWSRTIRDARRWGIHRTAFHFWIPLGITDIDICSRSRVGLGITGDGGHCAIGGCFRFSSGRFE